MKTMWYESSRTDTNGPCDEVIIIFFIWLVRDAANNSYNAIARLCWFLYGMLWCKKTKKLWRQLLFFCRVPAVSRLSSRQEMISLHTLSPPVLLKQDTAATTHVRSALNFAASAHRCKTLTGCWIWITHEVASTDVLLSHREHSALWFSFCCVVTPKRQALTKWVPRFTCRELYRVFPPRSALLRQDPNRILWLSQWLANLNMQRLDKTTKE